MQRAKSLQSFGRRYRDPTEKEAVWIPKLEGREKAQRHPQRSSFPGSSQFEIRPFSFWVAAWFYRLACLLVYRSAEFMEENWRGCLGRTHVPVISTELKIQASHQPIFTYLSWGIVTEARDSENVSRSNGVSFQAIATYSALNKRLRQRAG